MALVFKNLKRVLSNVGSMRSKAMAGKLTKEQLELLANSTAGEAKKSIAKISRGKAYFVSQTRKGKRKRHIASKPGDPPNLLWGNLSSSIKALPERKNWLVIATTDYARKLEFGDNKTAARPFFAPALKKAANLRGEEVLKNLARNLKKDFKK